MTTTKSPKSSPATATVPILFSCDAGYLPHAAACVASLMANNPGLHFDIVIASAKPLGAPQKKFIRSFDRAENISIQFRVFDILSALSLPLTYHYTIEAYIRLWIGEIFSKYERALYLDPDLIVLGGLKELWEVNLGNAVLGAVPIPASDRPELLGLPPGTPYFNSGVILFDLDRWRAKKCKERCLEHIKAHPEKLFDPDQDVLNLCLVDEWLPLSYKWNVISPFYYLSYDMKMASVEIEKVRRDARIIHFNGHSKPWSYLCNHPRRDEYWKYIRSTEWHDMALTDRTFFNMTKDKVSRMLPAPVKRAVRRVMAI
jgi:lipopolysaccharide biosynthesis glycosyltransferase